jgi:hypothetical protein
MNVKSLRAHSIGEGSVSVNTRRLHATIIDSITIIFKELLSIIKKISKN